MRRTVILAIVAGTWATSAAAQPALHSPYREELSSEIRGLSAQEIEDLREGRGMGLARAAELNGFPGPRHVLDAAEAAQLSLTPAQLAAVKARFARMSAEARRLGENILREEQALEVAFRAGTLSEPALRARVGRLATLHGELRLVHLRAHLETRALLDPQQLHRYNVLRGYVGPEDGPTGSPHGARH